MNSPIAATTLEAREKRTCHTTSPCADCATSLSAKAAARSAACTRPGDWPLTFSGSSSDFLLRRTTRRVMRSTRSKSEKASPRSNKYRRRLGLPGPVVVLHCGRDERRSDRSRKRHHEFGRAQHVTCLGLFCSTHLAVT